LAFNQFLYLKSELDGSMAQFGVLRFELREKLYSLAARTTRCAQVSRISDDKARDLSFVLLPLVQPPF
jgi:hypothetical protein